MLGRGARRGVLFIAMLGWGVLIVSAVPSFAWEASRNLSFLALALAGTGTMIYVKCLQSAPFIEVLEAGRAIGRAEAAAERDCDNVHRIDRSHLRAVDGR